MVWRRKNHRLDADRYVGRNAYSLTFVTEERTRYFVDRKNVEWCLTELENAASTHDFEVLAYVFMPDHLHLLAAGTADTATLAAFVKAFKQRTAFWFKKRWQSVLWQKSYYDHILRRDEDMAVVTEYLAGNPLHAGLVKDWQTHPFWGGRLLQALANEGGAPVEDAASSADLKVAATSVAGARQAEVRPRPLPDDGASSADLRSPLRLSRTHGR
jgi:REP element-mobilizing transposase RayT